MITKILTSLTLSIFLIGCAKDNIKPPAQIQDYVVVDPDNTPELNLNEIRWQAWNQTRLAEEAVKPSNKDKVFFVLSQEQLGELLDNLISISDVFAKSIENNQYWKNSIDAYREKKKAEAEKNRQTGLPTK